MGVANTIKLVNIKTNKGPHETSFLTPLKDDFYQITFIYSRRFDREMKWGPKLVE